MSEKILNAQLKTETGKNHNNRLREAGFIPGVLYSHGNVETIQIQKKNFFELFKGHISESVIFTLKIDEKKDDNEHLAFVKDYQKNPVTGEIIHLDFFKVTKGEKISTVVPIELVGSPVGAKVGGVVEVGEREIEIECLPRELPEKITVDISGLDLNDYIHASDINLAELGESVKLLSNDDTVIVNVAVPRAAEAEEELEEGAEISEEGGEASEEAASEE